MLPAVLQRLLGRSAPAAGEPGVLSAAREVALQTMEHSQALAELCRTELGEYAARQRRRLLFVVLAVFLLAVAYVLLCALAVLLLSALLGVAWALLIVLALQLLAAAALLLAAVLLGRQPLLPATRTELWNDWQCLRLLLKGNRNS